MLTLETILSLSWSIQPTVKLIYPAAIAVLVFFYANYLLDRFSTQTFTRIMMFIFAIQMFASLGLATLLPSLGVDNGGDDPNNAGAWQGIFAQKNMLGMSAALALAVTLGLRPRGASERIWRGLTFITTLIVAAGSRSREAWIAVCFQLILFTCCSILCRFRRRDRYALLLVASTSAVLVSALVYCNLDTLLTLMGRSRTASGRASIWEGAALLVHRRPWFGYGVYGVWHTTTAWQVVVRAGWNVTSSHNNYIEILLYFGLLGLALYLASLFLSAFYCLHALLSNSKAPETTPAVLILTAVFLLGFAAPITMYYPSAALLLTVFYISRLEQTYKRSKDIQYRGRRALFRMSFGRSRVEAAQPTIPSGRGAQ